jgi:hypothetical protein
MHQIMTILAVLTVLSWVGPVRALIAQVPPRPTPGVPVVGMDTKELVGTVAKMDAVAKIVEVAGLSGRSAVRVLVTPSTKIRIDSHPGQLGDVRESMQVRVAYEVRAGTIIATSIDVMPVPGRPRDLAAPPAAPSGLVVR